jgi:hypothetical protein
LGGLLDLNFQVTGLIEIFEAELICEIEILLLNIVKILVEFDFFFFELKNDFVELVVAAFKVLDD